MLLYNEVRFMRDDFNENTRIIREARIRYVPISSQVRLIERFNIDVSELFLQDNLSIELGDVTKETESGLFTLQ